MNHLKTLNLNLANNTFGLEYGEYYIGFSVHNYGFCLVKKSKIVDL